ncbi:hypothetical protein ACFL0P_07810 [Candidatus Omnitrophota bacterium]
MKIFLSLKIIIFVVGILFSLPTTVNAVGDYELLSITFDLTDDGDFSGRATYYYSPEEKVEFNIKNMSKKHFNFKGAKYYVVKSDKSIYRLEFYNLYNPHSKVKSFVCNPQQTIVITCIPPNKLKDLKGLFIDLRGGRRIYFEYEELKNWRTSLRKLLEAIDARMKSPVEEGWRKGSGNVYHYKALE